MSDTNAPTPPDTTSTGKKRLEFPASIAVRLATPIDTSEGSPSYGQIVMWNEKLPFLFVVDTNDPAFIEALAKGMLETAKEMRANPDNTPFIGKHEAHENVPLTLDVEPEGSNSPASGEAGEGESNG